MISVNLYSNSSKELEEFLSSFYSSSFNLNNVLSWEHSYDNPIEIADIIGVYADNFNDFKKSSGIIKTDLSTISPGENPKYYIPQNANFSSLNEVFKDQHLNGVEIVTEFVDEEIPPFWPLKVYDVIFEPSIVNIPKHLNFVP